MARGLTFDTGALIALERRDTTMRAIWRAALEDDVPITVPAVAVLEWWHGSPGQSARILRAMTVEPLDEELARAAGAALAKCEKGPRGSGPSVVDAVVVVSAARRGDVVYTSDVDDLRRICASASLRGARIVRI